MINVSDKAVKKSKHIYVSQVFFPENQAVCEIMAKNIV
jgi:hypothetical protein